MEWMIEKSKSIAAACFKVSDHLERKAAYDRDPNRRAWMYERSIRWRKMGDQFKQNPHTCARMDDTRRIAQWWRRVTHFGHFPVPLK